jgi:chaperone LolA
MRRAALFLVFLLMTPLLPALELSDVISKLEENEKQTESIHFDFNQTVQFRAMQSSATVSGEATFAKSGKMKIVKTKPEKQIMVSDGKKLTLYNPAYNQVWSGSWTGWVKNAMLPKGMVPLNNYVADLKKNFQLTLMPTADAGFAVIQAVPNDGDLGYQLELKISTENWQLARTSYRSETAEVVTDLSNVEVNPSTSPATFKLDLPKGVEVISLN